MGAVTGVSALPVCLNPQLLLKESPVDTTLYKEELGVNSSKFQSFSSLTTSSLPAEGAMSSSLSFSK